MPDSHLGTLEFDDPLYAFLTSKRWHDEIEFGPEPIFDVFAMDDNRTVFRYVERESAKALVGKYYGNKWLFGSQSGRHKLRARLMRQEFERLSAARALGFNGAPYTVVRPIATNKALNCLLLEEYLAGRNLDSFIRDEMVNGPAAELHRRLATLARFLAELHRRTGGNTTISKADAVAYFGEVLSELQFWTIITANTRGEFDALLASWLQGPALDNAGKVQIHGDVTPTNFVFPSPDELGAVDLERFGPGDGATDLGRMAAELKHLAWWYFHNPWASEPYIQQFYAAYREHLDLADAEFAALTNRARFHMACGLLRISRNPWLDLDYRRLLIEEARECLKD